MFTLPTLCSPSPFPISPFSLFPSQQPYFSYSAHEPYKVFAVSVKEGEWNDPVHHIYVSHTHHPQWVLSAQAVSRPQLLDVLNSSVGIEQLIYLYAKVGLTVTCWQG